MEDLDEAGGIPAVLKELERGGLLKGDCLTVTGKTVKENLKDVKNLDSDVVRPIDNPFSPTGRHSRFKGKSRRKRLRCKAVGRGKGNAPPQRQSKGL